MQKFPLLYIDEYLTCKRATVVRGGKELVVMGGNDSGRGVDSFSWGSACGVSSSSLG